VGCYHELPPYFERSVPVALLFAQQRHQQNFQNKKSRSCLATRSAFSVKTYILRATLTPSLSQFEAGLVLLREFRERSRITFLEGSVSSELARDQFRKGDS